ncbi:hypothetical protein BK133_21080 [Paenibacillus sp. FSL H8-0548]|nr:hypothetical protein BK133_21080 [Paenibacillus sp. FSL H8-0548]
MDLYSTINLGAEYVKLTTRGWTWVNGGSFGSSDIVLGLETDKARSVSLKAQYLEKGNERTGVDSPLPLIYGVVQSPDITRISIQDNTAGITRQATIIEVEKHFKLFYVFVDEIKGEQFDILGYRPDGSIEIIEKLNDSLVNQNSTEIDG